MKIKFVRSGGFAGLRLSLDVDVSDLAAEDAAQLTRLIDEARSALAQAPQSRPGPDRFQYELTIESLQWGRETHVLREPEIPAPVQPLIDQLTAMARRKQA